MDYDATDVYNRAIRKSRKEYKCIECGAVIPKGSQYEHIKSLYDGHWDTYRTCLPCMNIARSMGCRLHHGLYEQFYEMFGWNYLDDPADWEDDEDE